MEYRISREGGFLIFLNQRRDGLFKVVDLIHLFEGLSGFLNDIIRNDTKVINVKVNSSYIDVSDCVRGFKIVLLKEAG